MHNLTQPFCTRYGDYTTGAVDSQSFVVELLRRGKDAKNASARALRSANASRLQALQSREQQRTNQLLATKPATVDFDFRPDDIAKVVCSQKLVVLHAARGRRDFFSR